MSPQSERKTQRILLIIAFNGSDGGGILARSLEGKFDFGLLEIEAPLPEVRTRTGQVSADDLLSEVCRLRVQNKSALALGVTDADLFVPDLNFVFGLASDDGACSLVSTNRLRGDGPGLYRERLLKEAVHELGHVLGLRHCDDRKCVMHFSNSLRDTDIRSDSFCPKCSALLNSSN